MSSSHLKISELTEANTCKICNNAIGKYACPKCNILYCSLTCYQSVKHLECSEAFYKDCILENINSNGAESESKMNEILQRMHEENKLESHEISSSEDELDSDDDDDSELYKDLGERLAGIDLNSCEDVWDKLTDDEKKEFEAFLKSEEASKHIVPWEPWWKYRVTDKMIELSELNDHKLKCPKVIENIKPILKLSSKPPSNCVLYNMINVIAAYTFTLRYFNGDHYEHPKEAVDNIYKLSLNLSKSQNFDSKDLAVCSVTKESKEILGNLDEDNFKCLQSDVYAILYGPHSTDKKFYIFCVLSDFISLCKSALNFKIGEAHFTGFINRFTSDALSPEKQISNDEIKKIIKKLEYYLSYTKECYNA